MAATVGAAGGRRLNRRKGPAETGCDDSRHTLKFEQRDRGRLTVALVLTLLAVPTVWLFTRDRDASPGSVAAPDVPVVEVFDPLGRMPALFESDDSSPAAPTAPAVVVGAIDTEVIATARATYTTNADRVNRQRCAFDGIESGTRVTIVNVGNGREITCRIVAADRDDGLLVLNAGDFETIGSLVDAPLHVEIRR